MQWCRKEVGFGGEATNGEIDFFLIHYMNLKKCNWMPTGRGADGVFRQKKPKTTSNSLFMFPATLLQLTHDPLTGNVSPTYVKQCGQTKVVEYSVFIVHPMFVEHICCL